jgi:hypothetical protein
VVGPSFETSSTGWAALGCSSAPRQSVVTQSGSWALSCVSNSSTIFYATGGIIAASPGELFSVIGFVRSSRARQMEVYLSATNNGTEGGRIGATYFTVPADTWVCASASGNVEEGANGLRPQFNFRIPVVGETEYVDSVIVTAGSTQQPTPTGIVLAGLGMAFRATDLNRTSALISSHDLGDLISNLRNRIDRSISRDFVDQGRRLPRDIIS